MSGYRFVGEWMMHITPNKKKWRAVADNDNDADLISKALDKELIPFFKYLRVKAIMANQDEIFHKEFIECVEKQHEEHSRYKMAMIKISIQKEIEFYCKNYQVAVREAKFGEELLNEFKKCIKSLWSIIDYKCNQEWTDILNENSKLVLKIKSDLDQINLDSFKEVPFILSERGNFLKDLIDDE